MADTRHLEREADRLLGFSVKPGPRGKEEEAPDILSPRQMIRRAKREIPFGVMADFNPEAVGIRSKTDFRQRLIK